MAKTKPFYITTTLPYVNSDPHAGFALEVTLADAIARYQRLMGRDVFFSTGTDEHGQKIAQKADEAGKDRQEYVDYYAGEFSKLKEALGLSYDNFIRTTDKAHQEAAQKLWQLCDDAGDIYKKKYKGLYCVGCEMYLKDSDMVDGKCPNHPTTTLEEIEEENYFFKLSNYQLYLEDYLSEEGVILPEWRRQEALNFVRSGLEDFSISREVSRMDWGVPVPGDDGHVMYVWFDALTNYISTLGWPADEAGNFAKYWAGGETVQIAGKDQIRFQSIMWQAMLKSGGLPATGQVLYHGFINSGGQKMSKSIGNVISPYEMVERYGSEATRYILLRHVHPFDDSDITWEKMDEWYTANLVNGLGNLVARVMKMAETHLGAPVDAHDTDFDNKYIQAFDNFEFNKVADIVWSWIGEVDEQITKEEPFKVVKEDKERAVEMIKNYIEQLSKIAKHLEPIMPKTAEIIKKAIPENKKPENMFTRLE